MSFGYKAKSNNYEINIGKSLRVAMDKSENKAKFKFCTLNSSDNLKKHDKNCAEASVAELKVLFENINHIEVLGKLSISEIKLIAENIESIDILAKNIKTIKMFSKYLKENQNHSKTSRY